jgi:hypothetical protein
MLKYTIIYLLVCISLVGCASKDLKPAKELKYNPLLPSRVGVSGILEHMPFPDLMDTLTTLIKGMDKTEIDELGLIGNQVILSRAHTHIATAATEFDFQTFTPAIRNACENDYYNGCTGVILTGVTFRKDTASPTLPYIFQCEDHTITRTTQVDILIFYDSNEKYVDTMILARERDRVSNDLETQALCALTSVFKNAAEETVGAPISAATKVLGF